jgi:hypothetical protein
VASAIWMLSIAMNAPIMGASTATHDMRLAGSAVEALAFDMRRRGGAFLSGNEC